MYALVWYTLEGFVVDIYLFDCFHKLASIGTVLMTPKLKHFCKTTFYLRRKIVIELLTSFSLTETSLRE